MITSETLSSICPKCQCPGTMVNVKGIAEDYPNFVVDTFCSRPGCSYAVRNGRTGAKYHKMLNGVTWDRGKTMYVDYDVMVIARSMGISDNRSDDVFNKAFAGLIEYARPKRRKPELLLPSFNTWGYAPSSLRVSESKIQYSHKKE